MNRKLAAAAIVLIALITIGFLYLNKRVETSATAPESVYIDVKDGRVQIGRGEDAIQLSAGERGVQERGGAPVVLSGAKPSPVQTPVIRGRPRTLAVWTIDDVSQTISGASIVLRAGDAIIASGTSDESGNAEFSVNSDAVVKAAVRKEGYFDSGPVLLEGHNALTIVLDRCLDIRGKIVDEKNNSVNDAVVSIASASQVRTVSGTPFVCSPLRPGAYLVRAQHEALLGDEQIVHAGEKVVLRLGSSAAVIASVSTERGEAVGGAVLDLSSDRFSGFRFTAEEKTNTKGIAAFADIRKGTYSIGIQHPWHQSYRRSEVVVDSVSEEVFIILPDKNHSISGRVFDAQTREPIAGAPVVCSLNVERKETSLRTMVQNSQKASLLSATRTVLTDDDGFYRFDGLWSGLYVLFVDRMNGYISGDFSSLENVGAREMQRAALMEAEDVESVDFYLKKGWKISGAAFDPNGEPLAGVKVHAGLRYANRSEGRFSARDLAKFGAGDVTDEEGLYEIAGQVELMSDQSVSSLSVEGWQERYGATESEPFYLQPGESKENADLHFKNCTIVRGTVSDEEGFPISNANVDIWTNETDGKFYNELNMWSRSQNTDANGFYQFFINELFGDYYLRAYAEGYQQSYQGESIQTVTLTAGAEAATCDFILKKGIAKTLEGVVVNEESEALSGVFLRLFCEGCAFHKTLYTETQSSGRFVFELDAWDENWIRDSMANRSSSSPRLFRITPEDTAEYEYIEPAWDDIPRYQGGEKDIRIVMVRKDKDWVALRGTAVDASGRPVAVYDILAIPGNAPNASDRSSHFYRWTPVHSPDGTFSLDNLPHSQGPFRIAVRSAEYGFSCTEALSPEPNAVVEGITISFAGGATLSGVVLDAETGEPLKDVEVVAMLPPTPAQMQQISGRLGRRGVYTVPSEQSPLRENLASATTSENGEYHLKNVVIPAVRLRFRKSQYNDYFLPVMFLQSGDARELEYIRLIRIRPSE
ncbi:MAG: carboxypeptidase regulatory-like domain-containing protein [Candidatus Omnitrophica bacterium]|nr:carboxypeptidase regulatory-like domain-containing protein [Candidatus Omnitrophota bacterium]